MKKKVYIAMSADVLHNGHINIINEGAKLGDVIIGLLTDEAIATYKRLPILDYDTRKLVFENIKNVKKVVKQETLSYKENLLKIKPDYVIHGDDWKNGIQQKVREEVIETLNEYGGELIEVPYTKNISCDMVIEKLNEFNRTPDVRRTKLKRMLNLKPYINVMEASNGLTGIIVESAKFSSLNIVLKSNTCKFA